MRWVDSIREDWRNRWESVTPSEEAEAAYRMQQQQGKPSEGELSGCVYVILFALAVAVFLVLLYFFIRFIKFAWEG